MTTLTLPRLEELEGLETDRPISDPALPNKALVVAGATQLSQPVGRFTFNGSAGSAVRLAVVNSRDDEDPTGILALKGHAPDELEGACVASRVPFREGSGYVCLTGITAGVKATGGGELGDFDLAFEGAAEVTLGCVRHFAAATGVHQALTQIAADYPTFLSVADVLALGPNDAVSYAFNGRMELALTVELSDLAGSIAASADRIVAAAGHGVKIASGATVTCAVGLADSFRLVATKADRGRVRIAVRKEAECGLGIDAALGVTVAFAAAELLKPLDALSRAVFDEPWTKLEPLLEKSVGQLSGPERQRVESILARAGRDKLEDALNLAEYKQIVTGLRDALTRELATTFTAKWTFHYSRLTSDAAILQAVLDADALQAHHLDLIRFRLTGLLAAPAPGVEIEVFLAKRTKTIRFEYGLTLAWGDFTLLAGRTVNERTWITLTDRHRRRRASFLGKRGYTSTWLGERSTHIATLGATMAGFSSADPLRAIDYELGVSLTFAWDQVKFDDAMILGIADHAAVAAAIGPDDMDETLGALRQAHGLRKNARGSAVVHLQAGNDLLLQLLAEICGPARVDMTALAMGAALSYRADPAYALRQSVAARARAYGSIFKTYLEREHVDARDVARMAAGELAREHRRLATLEHSFTEPNGDRAWSAGAMVKLHSGSYPFRDTIKSLWLGCEQLHTRAQTGAAGKVIESAYGNLRATWENHYPTRLFAALLVEAAHRVPKGLERLQRRLEFQVSDARIVFARGSSE